MIRQILTILFFIIFSISIIEARNCIICDSVENRECATANGTEIFTGECLLNDDDCVTFIDTNGYTIRGCASELTCPDSDYCSQCEGNDCNNEIYPIDRIQCYQCSGTNCSEIVDDEYLEACRIYKTDDSCFTIVENEEAIYRGCYSDDDTDVGKSLCQLYEDENWCIHCSTNGCNDEAAFTKSSFRCAVCDSDFSRRCRYHIPKNDYRYTAICPYDLPLGRSEYCYQIMNGNRVIRGCLLDPSTSTEVIEQCDEMDDSLCYKCQEPECNNLRGIRSELCINCDGISDPDCELMTNDYDSYECPFDTIFNQGCYRSEFGGVVKRGCASELSEEQFNYCKELGDECRICNEVEDNCNAKVDFQRCFICDSSVDKNCAYVESEFTETICENYLDSCMQMISLDTVAATVRGCTSVIYPETCVIAFCDLCDDNYCNGKVFPPNRLKCNQCTGNDDCGRNLTTISVYNRVCPHWTFSSQCYSVITDDNQILRGCWSDLLDGIETCEKAEDKCIYCNGDNCNVEPATSPAQLSCIKCDENDPACSWGYDNSDAIKCTSDVYLGYNESCYYTESSDGKITRNCTLDNPDKCPEDSDDCIICTTTNCNKLSFSKQKCISCKSILLGQGSCAQTGEEIGSTDCSGEEQTYATKGCYSMKINDGTVIRGCSKDLNEEDLIECQSDNNDFCIYCSDNGCNNHDWSGARTVPIISILGLSIISILTKFT